MRDDARRLLERLGHQDFAYREFPGRFPDFTMWPLFAAVTEQRGQPAAGAEDARAMLDHLAELARTGAL
jgi:hypothetical protein